MDSNSQPLPSIFKVFVNSVLTKINAFQSVLTTEQIEAFNKELELRKDKLTANASDAEIEIYNKLLTPFKHPNS